MLTSWSAHCSIAADCGKGITERNKIFPVLPLAVCYAVSTKRRPYQTEAQRYLQAIATRLQPDVLDVRTQVVVAQQPAAAILEQIRERQIDLVAIATHGQSGLARLLLGSVADKVIRSTEIPVLLYRPQEATAHPPPVSAVRS